MLNPKGSTTTTTEAPVGKNRTFEFTSSVPGLEVKISFVQLEGNTLEMHCDVKTDPSATETLDRFCSMDTRPKIYLIEGYEDCSTLPSEGFVDGQMIAELDKPSKFFHTIRDSVSHIRNVLKQFIEFDLWTTSKAGQFSSIIDLWKIPSPRQTF